MRTFIVIFGILILFLTGCGNNQGFSADRRIASAEELMYTHPDSALALLNSINPDSIKSESDYACYALLSAQADYKVKGSITNSELLEHALSYYEKDSTQENQRLVMALVLKGIYCETAGSIAQAEDCYMRAEVLNDSMLPENVSLQDHRRYCLAIVDKALKHISESNEKRAKTQKLVVAIVLLLIVALIAQIVRMRLMAIRNLEMIKQLQKESSDSKLKLMSMLETETRLKNAISSQITAIREMIELSHEYSGAPATFMNKFKVKVRRSKLPEGIWKDLRYFIDENYNNIISRLEKKYDTLTDDELYIIGLVCCGFSYTEIAICMGYSNVYSANTKRARIARKMGLTKPLKEYIDELVTDDLE